MGGINHTKTALEWTESICRT